MLLLRYGFKTHRIIYPQPQYVVLFRSKYNPFCKIHPKSAKIIYVTQAYTRLGYMLFGCSFLKNEKINAPTGEQYCWISMSEFRESRWEVSGVFMYRLHYGLFQLLGFISPNAVNFTVFQGYFNSFKSGHIVSPHFRP